MEVLNIWVSLTSTEPVDPCGFTISWIPIIVRDTVPPIGTGPFPIPEMLLSCGVVPSVPVLLTCSRGVWRTRTLLHAAYVMTGFVVGVILALGVPPQVATSYGIRGSISVVMIGRVRLINDFCCKFPLLVSITFLFFPSLV